MDIFAHHIYEYQKGLRDLVLHTTDKENLKLMIPKLKRRNIKYLIYPILNGKYNIFFGDQVCLDVVKSINCVNLSNLSEEKDFILGIMLGYDRKKQCERYLHRNNLNNILVG